MLWARRCQASYPVRGQVLLLGDVGRAVICTLAIELDNGVKVMKS